MLKNDPPLLLGFSSDAAKESVFLHRVLKTSVVRLQNSLLTRTSTTKQDIAVMDVILSKHFKESKKFESSSFHFLDQDSGYMSYHHESNSDSSLENVAGHSNGLTGPSMSLYLSEDALLEKPDFDIRPCNLSAAIEKEDYEETRNMFNTPMTKMLFKDRSSVKKSFDTPETIISNSVVSEKSLYDGFDTSCSGSDISSEIPVIEPIILESKDLEVSLNNVQNVNATEQFSGVFKGVDNKIDTSYESEKNISIDYHFESMSMTQPNVETDSSINNSFDDSVKNYKSTHNEANMNLTSRYIDTNLSFPVLSNNSVNSSVDNLSLRTDFSCFQPPQSACSQKQLLSDSSQTQKESKTTLSKSNTSRILTLVRNNTELLVPKEKKRLTMIFSKTNMENKENIYEVKRKYPSLTPEKSWTSPVDPNISPDLFDDDISSKNNLKEPFEPAVSLPAKERYILKNDNQLLKQLQSGLSGVLPPPSMTLVNLSASEILERLESNKRCFWTNTNSDGVDNEKLEDVEKRSKDTSLNDSNDVAKSLLVNVQSANEFFGKGFPNVLEYRYHGLHYNCSKVSEQIEELCDKFAKRYVGAETQSTFTVFETNLGSPSKRKAQRQRWAVKSPGRRLSHLARRRITFSSASLQVGGSSLAGSRARQILVDARKISLQNRRRSPRKSPRKTPKKTPSKSPRFKSRTPSSSAKKKLAMRFKKISGEFEKSNAPSTSSENRMTSLKKALFKSPDKERPSSSMSSKRTLFKSPDVDKNSSLFLPSTSSASSSFDSDPCKNNPRRALFSSPVKHSPCKIKKSPFRRALGLGFDNKKRKRSESDDAHQDGQSKFPKNVTEAGLNQSKTSRGVTHLDFGQSSKLSRSMSVDIRPSQSECDNKTLFRTRSEMNMSLNRSGSQVELSEVHKKKLQWAVYEALKSQNVKPTHAQYKVFASVLARVTRRFLPSLTAGRSEGGGGTSERMLRIARQHVYAVVKGNSVDEVVNDYLRNRARTLKPQGYVAIEEFNNARNKTSLSNKENVFQDRLSVFQDRGNTIESREKQKLEQLGKPKCENKIDRIRKVINFGDDNR